MAKNRGIDWGRFIDIEMRSYGTAKPHEATTKKRLQYAYRIDTSVVAPLAHLPPSVASDAPPSLPQRNLVRGFELGLPSGQAVAHAMGVPILTDEQIVIGKAVDDPLEDGDVKGTIASLKELAAFKGNCPLWTYILAEAAHYKEYVELPVLQEGKKTATPQLGPVGGRIVAEVFLGLMFGDNNSYLNQVPNWQPRYHLKDFVRYALAQ